MLLVDSLSMDLADLKASRDRFKLNVRKNRNEELFSLSRRRVSPSESMAQIGSMKFVRREEKNSILSPANPQLSPGGSLLKEPSIGNSHLIPEEQKENSPQPIRIDQCLENKENLENQDLGDLLENIFIAKKNKNFSSLSYFLTDLNNVLCENPDVSKNLALSTEIPDLLLEIIRNESHSSFSIDSPVS